MEVDIERVSYLESFSQDVKTRLVQQKCNGRRGRFAHVWISEPESGDKDKATKGIYSVGDPDVLREIGDALEVEYAWYGYIPHVYSVREAEMLTDAVLELLRAACERWPHILPELSRGLKKIEKEHRVRERTKQSDET